MAWITNIRLAVGNGAAPQTQVAEVKCTINFGNAEVAANNWYRVRAYLYEEDDARDFFVMKPDGRMRRLSGGNRDDYVGHIESKWVQPNGDNTVGVVLSREWHFPELDDNIFEPMEKFFATVSIVPEMAIGDWEFSPLVTLDIG